MVLYKDHVATCGNMIIAGKGAQIEVKDYMLSIQFILDHKYKDNHDPTSGVMVFV
jgi:hypothetical protein